MNHHFNYKQQRIFLSFYILIIIFFSFALSLFDCTASFLNSAITMSFHTLLVLICMGNYLFICSSTYFYQFIFLIYAVKMRYQKINQCLMVTFSKEELIKNKKLSCINQIMKIHDDLNEIVEIINACFSFPVMFYLYSLFANFLMFLFGLITIKSYFNLDSMWLMFISNCVWNIYMISFPLIIMGVASATTREGQKTSSIVHKILNESIDREMDIKVCYLQSIDDFII